MVEKIHDLQQFIYNLSLLISRTQTMDVLIGTKDTLVDIPEASLTSDAAIKVRSKFSGRQFFVICRQTCRDHLRNFLLYSFSNDIPGHEREIYTEEYTNHNT